jgi:thioredoxin 1
MSHVTITDQNFEELVLKSDKVTLVDMWATWCMPCQILGPIIEEVADEMGENVVVGKLDVDENQNTAMKFNVMSIPTVMIFKGGKAVETFIGVQPKNVYVDALKKHSA